MSSLKRFLWPTASKARCAIRLRMVLTAGESLLKGSKSMKWQRQSQPYCVKTHRLVWKMVGASVEGTTQSLEDAGPWISTGSDTTLP